MIVDKMTEEIFLFFNYMDLNNAKDIYRFMVISSNDHGESWSNPKDITSQIAKKIGKKILCLLHQEEAHKLKMVLCFIV